MKVRVLAVCACKDTRGGILELLDPSVDLRLVGAEFRTQFGNGLGSRLL